MKKPEITIDKVKPLFESKFIKVFDLQYEEGKHYFDATRRDKENLSAIKSDKAFKEMLPDAVTCFVILKVKNEEPRLLTFYEYRYPTGQFLLSLPAGLMDPEDKNSECPQLTTARREIFEETGIKIKDTDKFYLVDPLVFSTPGMTDESNGIVCAVVELDDLSSLNQNGAEGSECFDGFKLLTKDQAREILKRGRDENGNFYSIFTWAGLCFFTADLWN